MGVQGCPWWPKGWLVGAQRVVQGGTWRFARGPRGSRFSERGRLQGDADGGGQKGARVGAHWGACWGPMEAESGGFEWAPGVGCLAGLRACQGGGTVGSQCGPGGPNSGLVGTQVWGQGDGTGGWLVGTGRPSGRPGYQWWPKEGGGFQGVPRGAPVGCSRWGPGSAERWHKVVGSGGVSPGGPGVGHRGLTKGISGW